MRDELSDVTLCAPSAKTRQRYWYINIHIPFVLFPSVSFIIASEMASNDSTVTLTAHCLCKAHTFTATIPASKLPLEAWACHCNSCRHVTGALYSIDAHWPEPRANVDTSGLKSFAFSSRIIVLFCGTCSTPIFFDHAGDNDEPLGVFTGALTNDAGNLVKIAHHIYVEDTLDGGATMWLRKPNVDGSEAKRWKKRSTGEGAEEYPPEWPAPETLTGYDGKKEDSIPIRCKCKGVNLVLHRGNYAGKKREELPWFTDPNTHKSVVGNCACDSCRLFSGIDLFNWAFTELKYVSYLDGVPEPFPQSSHELRALVDAKAPQLGTLAYYSSSPDIQRYFCSNCSACIFYAADDRSEMINVAVGVLEASDGARAEGFFSWSFGKVGKPGRHNDTEGGWRESLIKHVEAESEKWREERGYPKNWRRVEREEAEKKGESYY